MFLSDLQIAERWGVTRTTIWRWRKKDPSFPKPIQFSAGCTRWLLADIEAYEAAKSQQGAA